jgi:hypothetical protein
LRCALVKADDLMVMHDGHPVACVQNLPFAYVDVFKSYTNAGFGCVSALVRQFSSVTTLVIMV